jgi:hypothetical protein
MSFIKSFALSAALLLGSLSASAAVVGTASPATGNCYPFGCSAADWGPEYQQVYSSSAFSGSLSIQSLSFYNTKYDSSVYSLNPGTYSIYLSTTTAPYNALSGVMASNIGADEQLVYSGLLPSNNVSGFGGRFDFLLGSAFNYDPSLGNLLLRVTSNTATMQSIFLDMDMSGSVMSRVYDNGVGADGWGLVTGFNEVRVQRVPEPVSLLLAAGALLGLGVVRRQRS